MRSTRAAVVAVIVLLVLTGCGASPTPAVVDRVPGLGDRLARVDRAIVAKRYPEARAALRALIGQTVAAETSGKLSDSEAARVIAAAKRLLAELPRAEQVDTSEPDPAPSTPAEEPNRPSSPSSEPTPTPTPTDEAPEPEPTPSPVESPSDPGPSPEPSAEPTREATPAALESPAAL